MYIIEGLHKFAERDDYQNGCDPDTAIAYSIDMTFTGVSPQDTIKAMAEWCDPYAKRDDMLLNSCDEIGRVDIRCMEYGDGTTANTYEELQRWKRGEIELYAVTYTGYLVKRTDTPVNLETYDIEKELRKL